MRHGLPRASGAKCIVSLEGRMLAGLNFPRIFCSSSSSSKIIATFIFNQEGTIAPGVVMAR